MTQPLGAKPAESKPAPEPKTTKASNRTSTKTARTRPPKIAESALREALEQFYGFVGLGLSIPQVGFPNTAEAVAENAEACADAWITAAKSNEALWFTLQRLVSGGTMGIVIMAHMPILMSAYAESRTRRVVLVDAENVL